MNENMVYYSRSDPQIYLKVNAEYRVGELHHLCLPTINLTWFWMIISQKNSQAE